jgi:peptidylprolyl isomerase
MSALFASALLAAGVVSCAATTGEGNAADSETLQSASAQTSSAGAAERPPMPADSATEAHRVIDREAIEAYLKESGIKAEWKPNGMAVAVEEQGDGAAVKAGDVVRVHYTGSLLDGSVFDSSVERGEPLEFPIGQGRVIRGWDEGIPLFNVGGKGTLFIPSELGYGSRGFPGAIPEYSVLIFDIEVIDAFDPAERAKKAQAEGVKAVEEYVLQNGLKTEVTESGLHYIIEEAGTGTQAEAGKTVSVHYTGRFTDGKVFDSSVDRGEPISFPLGQGRVIPGWDEGIALFKVGGKGQLIIPPHLGYGAQARGPIPGNSVLVFDIELVDVQ